MNRNFPGMDIPVKLISEFVGQVQSPEGGVKKGMEIAGRMVRTLKDQNTRRGGIHLMVTGKEKVAPEILNRAGH